MFRVIEIESEFFFARAVVGGNPITVIRKRNCTPAAIAELHLVLNYANRCI